MNEPVMRDQLRRESFEYRGLEAKHQRLEAELGRLIRRRVLTPRDEAHKKMIQIEKLRAKDRMAFLIRRFENGASV